MKKHNAAPVVGVPSHLLVGTTNPERFTFSASDAGLDLADHWPNIIKTHGMSFLLSEVGSPCYEGTKLLGLEYRDVHTGFLLFVENN